MFSKLTSYFYAYFAADRPKYTDFSCVSTLIVAAHTRIWILSALRLSVHACIWILSALRIPVHKNIGASANISLLSPKEIYEPADLKSEKLLQGALIFSCNSLLYINYACQHHFCIFFCMQASVSALTLPVQLCITILSALRIPVQLCITILSTLTFPVQL